MAFDQKWRTLARPSCLHSQQHNRRHFSKSQHTNTIVNYVLCLYFCFSVFISLINNHRRYSAVLFCRLFSAFDLTPSVVLEREKNTKKWSKIRNKSSKYNLSSEVERRGEKSKSKWVITVATWPVTDRRGTIHSAHHMIAVPLRNHHWLWFIAFRRRSNTFGFVSLSNWVNGFDFGLFCS